MNETVIVAYIMGGFVLLLLIGFIIFFAVIKSIAKFRVKHDPYIRLKMKMGECMAKAQYEQYLRNKNK